MMAMLTGWFASVVFRRGYKPASALS